MSSDVSAGGKPVDDFSPSSRPALAIRPARPEDSATIANLVYELAVYEKLEEFAQASAEDFRHHLFGPRPHAEAILAEVDGLPVGFAMVFPTFSTFRGQPGLYLEDIFVRAPHRGKGIGKALLASVARLARQRGIGRLEWAVLNWNEPAIGFYSSLGARPLHEWTVYQIEDAPLDRLAALAATESTDHHGSDCLE
jgi:GNAT superfamily N-acetyltransferase